MLLSTTVRPVPLVDIEPAVRLRIIGAAGAGFPSPAQDWQDDAISLVELLRLDRPAAYVFRVSGSSMIDANLSDGDVVVVDRDTPPRNGHIVVAVVDSGFVVRQLVYRGGVPHLEPRNARAGGPAIVCDESVEVWGVVRASVRDHQR